MGVRDFLSLVLPPERADASSQFVDQAADMASTISSTNSGAVQIWKMMGLNGQGCEERPRSAPAGGTAVPICCVCRGRSSGLPFPTV